MTAYRAVGAIIAVALFAGVAARAEGPRDALPSPIAGISFDEWAAATARIGDEEPESEIRALLGASDVDWKTANDAFRGKVEIASKGSPISRRFAEIMNDPNVGRFATPGPLLSVKQKLATFDDYSKIRAQLAVEVRHGVDGLYVLGRNGLSYGDWTRIDNAWTLLHHGYDPSDPVQKRGFLSREQMLLRYMTQYRRKYDTERSDTSRQH